MKIRIFSRFGIFDWVLLTPDGQTISSGSEKSHDAALRAAEKARTHGKRTLGLNLRDGL